MATEVLRIRILKTMQAWLEGIDGPTFGLTDEAGTALADMTGRVKRGRIIYGDSDPLPMISILEVPIPLDTIVSPPDSEYSRGAWELLVQGFALDDPEYPTDPAHVLLAAAKQRLALAKMQNVDFDILGMGRHIIDLRIGAGVVRPPDEISAKAYFWLNLTLDLAEDLAQPFED
jgi:hypothetical protein